MSSSGSDGFCRRRTAFATAAAALLLLLQRHPGCGPSAVDAAHLLAVQSFPGKSHWNVMNAVLSALTDRGHHVTVFTPYADGPLQRHENCTVVDVSGEAQLRSPRDLNVTQVIRAVGSTWSVMSAMANATRSYCAAIYEHRRMTEILRRRQPRFDAVVVEPFVSECVSYAAAELRVPLVHVLPPPMLTYLERSLFGHAPNPAAVAHVLSRGGALRTFAERLANVALTVYCSAVTWSAERALAAADPRPWDRVDPVKPSLVFANTHFITEPSRPLPPNVVQIGGVHLSRPKAIPTDILEFIENSPHGVIYFTFGSIISMSSLPKNVQTAFRDALAEIPQRVLWKYEGKMKDKPNNVMTKKWFPQRDILLHPKVKLFISHGGISGVYEAVDAGVPVLGFPIYFDQPRNIGNLVEAGMAISLDLLSVSKDTFLNSVLKLINDERYRKNAKIASERFKDRPMSPAESVVYWTEYILRHKGAPHLSSHGLNLTWYQYYLVDVIATLLFVLSVFILVLYTCLNIGYHYIFKYFQKPKEKRE